MATTKLLVGLSIPLGWQRQWNDPLFVMFASFWPIRQVWYATVGSQHASVQTTQHFGTGLNITCVNIVKL